MDINLINGMANAIKTKILSEVSIPTTVIAQVVTPPPGITIEYSGMTIPTEQIYINNFLLPEYNRTYRVDGTTQARTQTMEIQVDNTTETSPAGEGPHTHAIPTISGTGTITTSEGTFQESGTRWLTSTLIPGQRVLCHIVGGMFVIAFSITEGGNISEQGA